MAVVLLHVATINGGPIMCFSHGSWLRPVERERERERKWRALAMGLGGGGGGTVACRHC